MRPIRWLSDDGKFEGSNEADVAAYEERQKNVLAWMDLPWPTVTALADFPAILMAAGVDLVNLAPRWLAFFQLHQQLMNDGDMGKWKQRMVIEIDALEQEFMAIVREPKTERTDFRAIIDDVNATTTGQIPHRAAAIIYADHRDNELQAREDAER